MTDVLVVAVEEIWPPRQGGQVRVAGLIDVLREDFDVAVAVPQASNPSLSPVPVFGLRKGPAGPQLRHFLSPRPRIGQAMLGPDGPSRLTHLVNELMPAMVLFTHSYLAAMSDPLDVPIAVDFANIESARLRTFAASGPLKNRLSALVETMKARSWEPRVARRAGLCLALAEGDARVLSRWQAKVAHVPNGVRATGRRERSPKRGHFLFLASADYSPNREAAEWLVGSVWPAVRGDVPDARLVIAGRRSDAVFEHFHGIAGVEVAGEVTNVEPLYREAAAVLAPVQSGGGQQLKVIEALSFGRVVVATSFSARSVPPDLSDLCVVADSDQEYAAAVVRQLTDSHARWDREQRAEPAVESLPTWRMAAQPVLEWLRELP